MSKHENTVNRTIDGDSAEGHLKLPNGATEVHQRQMGEAEVHHVKFDDEAEGHKHANLDDETEGHVVRQVGEAEVHRQVGDAEVNNRI